MDLHAPSTLGTTFGTAPRLLTGLSARSRRSRTRGFLVAVLLLLLPLLSAAAEPPSRWPIAHFASLTAVIAQPEAHTAVSKAWKPGGMGRGQTAGSGQPVACGDAAATPPR